MWDGIGRMICNPCNRDITCWNAALAKSKGGLHYLFDGCGRKVIGTFEEGKEGVGAVCATSL